MKVAIRSIVRCADIDSAGLVSALGLRNAGFINADTNKTSKLLATLLWKQR
jgi:hypothetical protein